jgi:hypothetical protein
MALSEADKKWIRQEFQGGQKPHGNNSVIKFIQEWSSPAVAVVILIFFLTEWTAYIEFRTQTIDRLTSIEKKLTTAELQTQAALPQSVFDKTLAETREVVAAARKQHVGAPAAVIEELRSKLIASNSDAPDFWPTVSEFISYQSLTNYRPSVQAKPAGPLTGLKAEFRFETLPDCTDSLPRPMTVKEVLNPNQLTNNPGVYENCRFIIDSATQDAIINTILNKTTPFLKFENCLIEYHGGEINLILAWDKAPFTITLVGKTPEEKNKIVNTTISGPAIQFENCLFHFSFQNMPPPNGQRLSTTVLAANTSSISLPVAR